MRRKGKPRQPSTPNNNESTQAEYKYAGVGTGASDINEIVKAVEAESKAITNHNFRFEGALLFFNITHLFIANANIYRTNYHNYNFYLMLSIIAWLSHQIIRQSLFPSTHCRPVDTVMGQAIRFGLAALAIAGAAVPVIYLFFEHPIHIFFCLTLPFCIEPILFQEDDISKLPSGPEKSALYLKTVVFRAVESTFMTTILPIIFIKQEHLYYDSLQCALLAFYAFTNLLSFLATHMFATHFVELSLQAQMQGGWAPLAPGTSTTGATSWTNKNHGRGAVVSHRGCYYTALEENNMSEPGAIIPRVVSFLCSQPGCTYFMFSLNQTLTILAQFACLLTSHSVRWWLTYSVMLFSSVCLFWLNTKMRREHMKRQNLAS